jgi:hypothetical protein
MSQGGVDNPEIVQVQGHYRDVCSAVPGLVQGFLQTMHEQRSIGQIDKRVVVSQPRQPFL